MLEPEALCVEASDYPVTQLLDGYGFHVIPVPCYEVSPFGGGLHCATTGVHREGTLEDYFPVQVAGF